MTSQAEKTGYPVSDMGVYIQPIVQGTGCHVEFNLFYDSRNAAQVRTLSGAATRALMAQGVSSRGHMVRKPGWYSTAMPLHWGF
jgi:hypothetical protein